MYLIKTPGFIQELFPAFTWKIPTEEKVIYLTFDDGPIPEITPFVLRQLKAYDAQATFFCVGDNIRRFPHIYLKVKEAGHSIGNHTFNHLSGWATDNAAYFNNARKCARQIKTDLFRPPYGRLKPSQAKALTKQFRIVMWDVLSGDFDESVSPQQCYENVVQSAGPGSIVVFHDNTKARRNLYHALPRVLEHFSELGYSFRKLSEQKVKTTGLKSA